MKVLNTVYNYKYSSYNKLSDKNTPNYSKENFKGLPTKKQVKLLKYFHEHAPKKRKEFYAKYLLGLKDTFLGQIKREICKYKMYREAATMIREDKKAALKSKRMLDKNRKMKSAQGFC